MTGGFRVGDTLEVSFLGAIFCKMPRITTTETVSHLTLTITTSYKRGLLIFTIFTLIFLLSFPASLTPIVMSRTSLVPTSPGHPFIG